MRSMLLHALHSREYRLFWLYSDCVRIPRVVLVGDAGVGKTCLLSRFANDKFIPWTYKYSSKLDFKTLTIRLDGKDVKVQIFDADELSRSITSVMVRGVCGVVIVYDVTNQESFNNLGEWLDVILDVNAIDLLLIGNKCVLTTQKVVDYATAKEFADKHGISLIETSAKTSINVDQAFVQLISAVRKRMSEQHLRNHPNI